MTSLDIKNPLNNISNAILMNAVENSRGPLVITDISIEDNPIIYCNPAFLEMTGYSYSEIIGYNCRFLQGEDTDITKITELSKAVQRSEHARVVIKNYKKDKTPFWNDLLITPLFDQEKQLIYYAGMQLDITDRIEFETKLQRASRKRKQLADERDQLIEMNKSKDEFISIASHQLRTPATAVKQYMGMILEGFVGDVPENQRLILQKAYESNERQLKSLNDLLKTARIDSSNYSLSKTDENIEAILSRAIDDLKPIVLLRAQDITYVPNAESAAIVASVDKDELTLILTMILENASKYSNRNTTIETSLTTSKSQVLISIKDHGVGIESKNFNKIFEKFTRINNDLSTTINGTGLGLYWVKRIVDLHEGTIKINSKIGNGTEFIIGLPRG